MAEHETDWQRARRQRSEVKKYGVTTANPSKISKQAEAIKANKVGARKQDFTGGRQGNWMKVHKLDR